MDLDQANWLLREGVHHLTSNSSSSGASGRGLLPWQASLLRMQRELQQRSSNRFPDPHQWLWTQRSLGAGERLVVCDLQGKSISARRYGG